MAQIDWPSIGEFGLSVLTLIGSGAVVLYGRGAANARQTAAVEAVADSVKAIEGSVNKLRTDFEVGMRDNHRENSDKFDRMEVNNQRRFDEANAGRVRLGEYIRAELVQYGQKMDTVINRVGATEAAIRSLETSRDESRHK